MITQNHQDKRREHTDNFTSPMCLDDINERESCVFEDAHYIAILSDLFLLSQRFSYQIDADIALVCHEITRITHGYARVTILQKKIRATEEYPISSSPFCFPLLFHDFIYGTLTVLPDRLHPNRPVISLAIASLLAQICSLLLHTLEQSALLQLENSQISSKDCRTILLTEREKEILHLLCHGYDQVAIANLLCISEKTAKKHKHNIYGKLNVHSKQEAIKTAYLNGLFSPIETFDTTSQ